jgi:hypothetical protein
VDLAQPEEAEEGKGHSGIRLKRGNYVLYQRMQAVVIKGALAVVLVGVVVAAAAVLYVAREHHEKHLVRHTVARPTEAEYRTYVESHWLYDVKANDAAKSMLQVYWNYRNGKISDDALRQTAGSIVSNMRHLNANPDRTAPYGYGAFDRKVNGVIAAEIECVNYFTTSRGILVDALGDQLYRLTVQFSGVAKSLPNPHRTAKV